MYHGFGQLEAASVTRMFCDRMIWQAIDNKGSKGDGLESSAV
jgi:hypothetical protein